jgi:HEAT repeat protein
LIDFLSDPLRCEAATDALSDPAHSDSNCLREGLRHPSVAARLGVVGVLERLKRPDASELLRIALNDENPSVRIAASGALSRSSRKTA